MYFFLLRVSAKGSRDSVVGRAAGYGMHDRGIGVRVPIGAGLSSLHLVQTGSGSNPTSYPVGIGASFHGEGQSDREADHSPPTRAEIKNKRIYTSTSPHVFVA
jgi:hypothetical protein